MTDLIATLEGLTEAEELRKAAHEAPLAKVYETHTGHKFIGVHTDAWWKASRAYFAALEREKRG